MDQNNNETLSLFRANITFKGAVYILRNHKLSIYLLPPFVIKRNGGSTPPFLTSKVLTFIIRSHVPVELSILFLIDDVSRTYARTHARTHSHTHTHACTHNQSLKKFYHHSHQKLAYLELDLFRRSIDIFTTSTA